MTRREFFNRYELVEAEAEGLERSGGAPAPAAGEEWPDEVRQALKKVESFVSAAFQQPRPVAQGTFEIGDLVVLFRVVSKNPPPEPVKSSEETPAVQQPTPRSASRRPSRRRKTR